MTYKIFFAIILLSFFTSCNHKKKEYPVEYWYQTSLDNIKKGNLYSAKESLEKIELEFPYSKYSDKAEILIAFIHYLNKDYEEASVATEKFIKLRPANQYVSYMYFLRAQSYAQQMSDYLRDQTLTQKAKNSFLQLISRFTNQKYHDYAIKSLNNINNTLANYNLDIGRVHQTKEEYVSAIARFNIVINRYYDSIYAPEAYFRLIETYYALGLTKQAQYQSKILHSKFPDNIWNKRNLIFIKQYVTQTAS